MNPNNVSEGIKDFKCSDCGNVYKRLYDLRKHVKKLHTEKLNEIAPLKKLNKRQTCASDKIIQKSIKVYDFKCDICDKNFTLKKHLTFHKKVHGIVTEKSTKHLKCPLCEFSDNSKENLYKHFAVDHNIQVDIEQFELSSWEEFENWKKSIECESNSRYIKGRGDMTNKIHNTYSYVCHRSGNFISQGNNKRHLKIKGSKKIGAFCPSRIKVQINNCNYQCRIIYIKTHVGHDADLGHIYLTKEEREIIASKIALKIPFDEILDDIRYKALCTEESVQRLHLLTKKDLFNITASYNLKSDAVRHTNDAISVEAWIEEMKENNCVLFYKPQNFILNEWPFLNKEDFVLIIMNEGQAQMLKKFSSDCVCIDGTHGLNAYNFELHTLLVLDELRQGFPVGFLISNRSDQDIMVLFFSFIKNKIGYSIKAKVFMSDMAESYYIGWTNVMMEADMR